MAIVTHTEVPGQDISALAEHIDMVLEGVPDGHKIIALLACVLVTQKADLTNEQVRDAVKDISHYICLYLDGIEGMEGLSPEERKLKIN